MAHEIQRANELKAGSSIYHDGGDEEDDDEDITKEVSRLAQGSAEGAATGGRGASLLISVARDEGMEAFVACEVDGDETLEESQATQMSDGGYEDDDVVVVSAHKSLLPSPEEAQNEQLDIEHGEEAAGEASAPGTELVVRPAESVTGLQVSDSFLAGDRETTSDDGHELPVQAPVSLTDCLPGRHGRAMGRPRRGSHKAIPTQTRPDGPTLQRNPENEAADTTEMARFHGLSAVSNRLGGRDLRVLRDNFEEMGGRPRTPVEKRAVSESPRTPTFAANKRICAKKRLEALESSVSNLPDSKESTNQEMVQMMTFFS
ncbi:hypothetical protein DVH05_028666 [Phytophthora capsici]|nr:hypothetical protein DVH05_028666 [Phytophthora capsici]